MAHTIVTNYSDLHPTPKDNSLVVVFNKDGTINLDKETLQSLITQPSESTLLSFVRVTDDGKSEDHSDHSSDDGTTPHINLTVDAFFEDNAEIFDDVISGSVEDILSPLNIDIKEHCLEAFKNDHCYTPLVSPSQTLSVPDNILTCVDLENDIVSHSIAKPQIPNSKKITILEQKIIPKGKTLLNVNANDAKVILKGVEALRTSLSGFGVKNTPCININRPIIDKQLKIELQRHEIDNKSVLNKSVSSQSSSDAVTSDSDSDYKDSSDRKLVSKTKPKQAVKIVRKAINRKFSNQNVHANTDTALKLKKVLHGKNYSRSVTPKNTGLDVRKLPKTKLQKVNKLLEPLPPLNTQQTPEVINQPKVELKTDSKTENKLNINQEVKTEVKSEPSKIQKSVLKKEKKTPSHVTALLSDMTSLFSTPDVIRRVSSDSKIIKTDKQVLTSSTAKTQINVESTEKDLHDSTEESKLIVKTNPKIKTYSMGDAKYSKTLVKESSRKLSIDKPPKDFSADIPHLDESALAQLFTDPNAPDLPPLPTTADNANVQSDNNPKENLMMSPNTLTSVGLAGSLSPSLDLLSGLQADDEDLSEDFLRHVAHLVENNEKLQEVIDKQVLGKVTDNVETKMNPVISHTPEPHLQNQALIQIDQPQQAQEDIPKVVTPISQKQPVQIVRSDGRVITLPPIEAPATRSSKRKSLNISQTIPEVPPMPVVNDSPTPKLKESTQNPPKQYTHKKLVIKKNPAVPPQTETKIKEIDDIAESDASWNSEDDPNRLWCICKQPHNNRFMICCDSCEDWFHGKCVNITKAMGHQMEEQGVEWNCPNCLKRKAQAATLNSNTKILFGRKSEMGRRNMNPNALSNSDKIKLHTTNTTCIVCKKAARASSIYCSDVCILRHAQESSSTSQTTAAATTTKSVTKQTEPDRVIVYERKTGRVFAGPKAPTSANLKAWLQQNPTFEVVSPGTLNSGPKPPMPTKHPAQKPKIQTTLKVNPQKQVILVSPPRLPGANSKQQSLKLDNRESVPAKKDVSPQTTPKSSTPAKREVTPQKTPKSTKGQNIKPSANKPLNIKAAANHQSPSVKSPPPSSAKRRDDFSKSRSDSLESNKEITLQQRNTVKKSLQDQMTLRMADTNESKMTGEDVKKFADETEIELYELFNKDNAKYKAKYRSLVFNIGDKKNKSLWQKICDGTVTPRQLVRLSPEDLASQELAQWRDKEAKHQLELIKKSELDLLTCTKTYVLKTHKGEEVMESRSSGNTAELDPNVAVEDLVTALNDPSGASKQLSENQEHSQDRHKNNKHKSHKTSKKSKRDHSSGRKEDISSHKHFSKHSSKELTKKDDSKSRDSRKTSHKNKHKDKSEHNVKSLRSKSKETTAISEKTDAKRHDHVKHRSKSRGRSKHRSPSRGKSKRSRSGGRLKRRSHSRGRSGDRSKRRSRSRGRSRQRFDSKVLHKRRSYSKEMDSSEMSSSSKEGRIRRISTNDHERSLSQESSDKSKSYQADSHPEYDPHVAMVTSALSEEDLRRSKDDDESSVVDMLDSSLTYVLPQEEYDPAKSGDYSLVSSTPVLRNSPDNKLSQRLSSGTESDQEPSSTVDSVPVSVWNGCINMVDVARFYVTAHEVSGNCSDIGQDLSSELEIVGRINPDTVWDYIVKMKKASNKDILVLRLTAANVEERVQYIALYSYLSSRNRLGVIKVSNTMFVKDFYILPLSSHAPIPAVLLPLDGPGFEDIRPHLLVGVMIRQRKKRPFSEPAVLPAVIPPKISKIDKSAISTSSFGKDKSYTPPTSPRSNAVSSTLLLLPNLPPLSALSSSVKDKIAASLAAADNDNEPYSPGGSDSNASSESAKAPLPQTKLPTGPPANEDLLSRKLEELDRKIAEERKQIISISKNINSPSVEMDEPYSPSRPMTPAATARTAPLSALSDISLPSNLQEILATIQKKTQLAPVEEYVPEHATKAPAVADVDMRVLNPPLPPHDFSVPPPPFFPAVADSSKGASKLSMLSDEELLKMVPAEAIAPPPMLPAPQPPPPPSKYHVSYRKMKLDLSQPPPPGLEDDI